MITLMIAPNTTPPGCIKLHSGVTLFPRDGIVRVDEEAEAVELEGLGWQRDEKSKQAKAAAADLLQKAAHCQIARMPGIGSPTIKSKMPSDAELLKRGMARQLEREPHAIGSADPDRRVEIGEVETQLGRVRVTHSRDSISFHGVHVMLSEIDADLRGALFVTAGAYNAAQDAAEQTSARAAIGTVIDAVLTRHQFLTAKVREAKLRERYDN